MQHLVSGCEKWAQKEYKRRNDDVAMKVYCDLCKKNGLDQTEKWYENFPEGAIENKEVKVMWDMNVQYDNMIETRKTRIKQYKQNQLFIIDQKKLFAELNGKTKESNEIPDAGQSRVFLSGTWSESKEHYRNGEWPKKLKVENNCQKKKYLVITNKIVSKQSRKIPNWRAPGKDGVQGF